MITVTVVWIPGLNLQRFGRFYFSVHSFVFVSVEKIYQTLETVFQRLSKHLEFLKNTLRQRVFIAGVSVFSFSEGKGNCCFFN